MCPVQRIEINGDGPKITDDSPQCIHCSACITTCPFEAIDLVTDWTKWNKLFSQAAKGEGFLVSNEVTKSEVY